ncbi:MAG: hypothetical protein AVDCRST_MAG07-1840, partial [uncultured Frankineae bacterium]
GGGCAPAPGATSPGTPAADVPLRRWAVPSSCERHSSSGCTAAL